MEIFFNLKVLSRTVCNRYSHNDNLVMNDKAAGDAVLESVKLFKEAGGGCIVENSTTGLHRRTAFNKMVSQETGVHVVQGTGNVLSSC